jgi:hypothetical protein
MGQSVIAPAKFAPADPAPAESPPANHAPAEPLHSVAGDAPAETS